MKSLVLLPVVLMLLAVGGCQQLGYLGYLLAPAVPAKPIEAEFDKLPSHSVAVVIFADQQTQYEYPYARLTLGQAVSAELAKQIENVTVVDVRKVCRYQDENFYWETQDKTQLAKNLGADYILVVNLLHYATREPGSLNLYRGSIASQPSLFDAAVPEHEAKVWAGQITVTHPSGDTGGIPAADDRNIRETVEKLFARDLIRKFYKHKPGADDDEA